MFNFFDLSIIPTFLSRFQVKKVLAIGLSNELIMNELIPFCIDNDCFLSAIDPKIDINDMIKEYAILNEEFKGDITYYKEDSLNVLPELNAFDAVFIDGDPNWYTVYNELSLIKKNNQNFPIVFVCNNKYPHKRRDSYINPEKIPEEFKNECCNDLPILYEEDGETKRTMVKDGFCHAINKDTPKNGVLTAIEDFLKENNTLELLEINPLEGVSLIYQPSERVDIRIDKILEKEIEHDYAINDLSDKFIENNILLKHVSRINLLKDDLDRVEEFKTEIKDKNIQLKKYENKIDIQNSEIEYKESKINNIESQISLRETKLQKVEAQLLKKDYEIKEKEIELSSKDAKIKDKENELNSINSQLLTKENELETTKNRLMNLEANFLDNKKELENAKKQLSKKSNTSSGKKVEKPDDETIELKNKEIDSLKVKLNQKDAEIKSQNRRINALKKKNSTPTNYKLDPNVKVNSPGKDSLTKRLLSPFSYVYIIGKSKPSEIITNIKLYKALKKSDSFDADYYLKEYPDIANSKWDKYFSPQLHYVCNGFDENRAIGENDYSNKNRKELLKEIENS